MKIGIVGCGINGAYLAYRLAKKHDVTVFEKNKRIGKKPCSCLVSKRIWNFIPENKKLIKNFISEALIHFPKKEVKLKFHPKLLVLNRRRFDQHVAKLARKNEADIHVKSKVKKVYFVEGYKPSLLVSKKILEFDYVIGCDGFDSIVRESIDIEKPNFKLGIYAYKRERDKSNKVDVFPTENGFAWKIPRGKRTEYGILEDMKVAKEKFNEFCESREVKTKKIYSYVIPEGLVKTGKGRVALCGDAMGLTKPLSGGGIIWGLIACDILLKYFPDFEKYNDDVKKFFQPKILISKVGNKVARFFGNNISWLLPKEVHFDSDMIY